MPIVLFRTLRQSQHWFCFVSCISMLVAHYTALLTLAFLGSIGMTFVIIACTMDSCWLPMIVVLFYILAPIPTFIAQRNRENGVGSFSSESAFGLLNFDFGIFITMGLVVSSFALPIIFARVLQEPPVITPEACYLTLIGNVIIYLTLTAFFMVSNENSFYNNNF